MNIPVDGVEATLLQEEFSEGHKAQLKRTKMAYRSKNSNDFAIFEYAWCLTRAENNEAMVKKGIRILKALQFQNAEFSGYAYLTIAQAYLRLGDFQNCRRHAHMLIQAYPKTDPERNSNLRKAIELHRQVRTKTTESGWKITSQMFVAGLVAALGVVAMQHSRLSAGSA
jgi:hypothetical protein